MSISNRRNKCSNTIHHITNRIAHKVYFLGDDERNDLLEIVHRAACFCGVDLFGWCIMTNHFHLLVYLPAPEELTEDEILARYAVLKGAAARETIESEINRWRADKNETMIRTWFDRQRARMYDIGEFMRIVKQWFTEDFNARKGHVGTLWESVYRDRVVKGGLAAVGDVLVYIHLNPIRSGICVSFSEYRWSSLTAFRSGKQEAGKGLRYVYGEELSDADLVAEHESRMYQLLETVKLQRAEEIARRRADGFETPCDPLTTEAMILQAAVHLKNVQHALDDLHAEDVAKRLNIGKRELNEQRILAAYRLNPTLSVDALAQLVQLPKSTLYRYMSDMRGRGLISSSEMH